MTEEVHEGRDVPAAPHTPNDAISHGPASSPQLLHHLSYISDSGKASDGQSSQLKSILPDADEMRRRVRQKLAKKQYDVHDFYYTEGFCQFLARNHKFEQLTLGIISINALYMGIDADWNDAAQLQDAHPVFQVCENLFCAFFSFELTIRFGSFRRKCNCLKDLWFVFDSTLVTIMVLETWIMAYLLPVLGVSMSGGALGNAGILRLLRLLRLSRMSRMARLLRSVPELMILLKGIAAASSSCAYTGLLLAIAMYIWALALKQLSSESAYGEKYFPDIPLGMYNLLLSGCFMKGFDIILLELRDQSILCFVFYFLFVLFAGVTIMKMLTGMLCKVINAVAASETEKMSVGHIRDELLEVLITLGYGGEGVTESHNVDTENLKISADMFAEMMQDHKSIEAFTKIGVDVIGLSNAAEFIFPAKEGDHSQEDHAEHLEIGFFDFMERILQLRGSNTATVRDMVEMRKFLHSEMNLVESHLGRKIAHLHRRVTLNGQPNVPGNGQSLEREQSQSNSGSPQKYREMGSMGSNMSEQDASAVPPSGGSFSSVFDNLVEKKTMEEQPGQQTQGIATGIGANRAKHVFEQYCLLNQAERGRFLVLLAGLDLGSRKNCKDLDSSSENACLSNGVDTRGLEDACAVYLEAL